MINLSFHGKLIFHRMDRLNLEPRHRLHEDQSGVQARRGGLAERMAKRLYAMGSARYRNKFEVTLLHGSKFVINPSKKTKLIHSFFS